MVKYKLTELIEHVIIQYIPIGLLVTHARSRFTDGTNRACHYTVYTYTPI